MRVALALVLFAATANAVLALQGKRIDFSNRILSSIYPTEATKPSWSQAEWLEYGQQNKWLNEVCGRCNGGIFRTNTLDKTPTTDEAKPSGPQSGSSRTTVTKGSTTGSKVQVGQTRSRTGGAFKLKIGGGGSAGGVSRRTTTEIVTGEVMASG